jgi:hypothetical protein
VITQKTTTRKSAGNNNCLKKNKEMKTKVESKVQTHVALLFAHISNRNFATKGVQDNKKAKKKAARTTQKSLSSHVCINHDIHRPHFPPYPLLYHPSWLPQPPPQDLDGHRRGPQPILHVCVVSVGGCRCVVCVCVFVSFNLRGMIWMQEGMGGEGGDHRVLLCSGLGRRSLVSL